jgi:hypothetical protein
MLTCTALALGVSLGSYHLNRDYPFHETNPGAYAICDDWIGGAFRNSFGRWSVHAGRVFKLGPVDIEVGLATGYQRRTWHEPPSEKTRKLCTHPTWPCYREEGHGGKIALFVVPSVRVENVRIGFVPPTGGKHKGALTFGVEW